MSNTTEVGEICPFPMISTQGNHRGRRGGLACSEGLIQHSLLAYSPSSYVFITDIYTVYTHQVVFLGCLCCTDAPRPSGLSNGRKDRLYDITRGWSKTEPNTQHANLSTVRCTNRHMICDACLDNAKMYIHWRNL